MIPINNLTLYEGGPNPVQLSNSSGNAPDSADGLAGNLTATYQLSASGMIVSKAILVWTSTLGTWVGIGNGTEVDITYGRNLPIGLSLKVDQAEFRVGSADWYVLLGKLGVSPSPVEFRFHDISFVRSASGKLTYTLVLLGFAALLPAWLITWSTIELWRFRWLPLRAAGPTTTG